MNDDNSKSAIHNIKVTPIIDGSSNDHSVNRNIINNNIISNKLNHTSYDSNMNELIPYPISCISTIIEKANNNDNNNSDNNNSEFTLKITKKRPPRRKRNQLFKQSSQSTISQQSSHDDVESIKSVSLCQTMDCASHDVNLPNQSLDLTNIIKRLSEKSDQSTQTTNNNKIMDKCNQYVQVNISLNDSNAIRIEQQRSNQALRNQIDQLTYIIEEMSKERSNRDIYMHQLQKQLAIMNEKMKEFENEKQQTNIEQKELKTVVNNSETIINTYQREISMIKSENEQLRQRLLSNIDNRQLKNDDELKIINEKDNLINNLTFHLNAFQQENIRLKNELLQYQQQQQQQNNAFVIHHDEQDFRMIKIDAIKLFKEKLFNIKNNCRQLQQQLNELRTKAIDNNDNRNVFVEKLAKQLSSSMFDECLLNNDKINSLKRMNEQLLEEKNQYIQHNYELESSMNRLKMEIEQFKQINNNLNNDNNLFKNKLVHLQQQYDDNKIQIDESNQTINELHDQIEKLSKIIKENDDKINNYEKNESIIDEQTNTINDLRKKIDNLNNEHCTFENRLNQLQQSLQDKELIMKQLNNDIDQQSNQYQQQIQSLENELMKEKERCKGLSLTLAKQTFHQQQQKRQPLFRLHCRMDELRKEYDHLKMVCLKNPQQQRQET